jgi:hypothetical protein
VGIRARWSAVLQILLFLATAIGLLGVVIDAIEDLNPNQPVQVKVHASEVQAPTLTPHLKPGARFAGADDVLVEVEKPSTRQRVLHALTKYPLAVGYVVVFFLLYRLVAKARYADPFTAATVRRMRVLAGVVLVGGVLVWIVTNYANDALLDTVADGTVWPAPLAFTANLLLPGFALLAGAEVVNIGRRMRAELAEVI